MLTVYVSLVGARVFCGGADTVPLVTTCVLMDEMGPRDALRAGTFGCDREIKTLGGTTGASIFRGDAAIATPGVARGCKPFLPLVVLREIKTLGVTVGASLRRGDVAGVTTGASLRRGDAAIATPDVARGCNPLFPLVICLVADGLRLVGAALTLGLFPSLVISVVMTVDFSFPACRLFRSVRELIFRSMSCY